MLSHRLLCEIWSTFRLRGMWSDAVPTAQQILDAEFLNKTCHQVMDNCLHSWPEIWKNGPQVKMRISTLCSVCWWVVISLTHLCKLFQRQSYSRLIGDTRTSQNTDNAPGKQCGRPDWLNTSENLCIPAEYQLYKAHPLLSTAGHHMSTTSENGAAHMKQAFTGQVISQNGHGFALDTLKRFAAGTCDDKSLGRCWSGCL